MKLVFLLFIPIMFFSKITLAQNTASEVSRFLRGSPTAFSCYQVQVNSDGLFYDNNFPVITINSTDVSTTLRGNLEKSDLQAIRQLMAEAYPHLAVFKDKITSTTLYISTRNIDLIETRSRNWVKAYESELRTGIVKISIACVAQ